MGKLDGKYIRGLVGDTVFKKVGKKQVVQGKSKKKIKQTVATKKAAGVFGKASNMASDIRVALAQTIGEHDGMAISRFTGENALVLNSALIRETQTFDFSNAAFDKLNGFEFNIDSPVRKFLFAQPAVTTTEEAINVTLPEMHIPRDLKFPTEGKNCILAFQAALFDLENYRRLKQDAQSVEIKYEYKPLTIPTTEFNFTSEPGCLCVITVTLRYFVKTFAGNLGINSKSFNPAAILKAFMIPGTVNPDATKSWREMSFNVK
nr:hypothetical protein [Pedobacter panaciterrae]